MLAGFLLRADVLNMGVYRLPVSSRISRKLLYTAFALVRWFRAVRASATAFKNPFERTSWSMLSVLGTSGMCLCISVPWFQQIYIPHSTRLSQSSARNTPTTMSSAQDIIDEISLLFVPSLEPDFHLSTNASTIAKSLITRESPPVVRCSDHRILPPTNSIPLALVVYEYIITLDQEAASVWKRNWTASSVLLLSIRWVMILNQVTSYVPASSKVWTLGSPSLIIC